MYRLALLATPLLALSMPALAADLDEPYYRQRTTVIERPPPPVVVERERIVERTYRAPPVYSDRAYFDEPRVAYAPRYVDSYAPHGYNYEPWRGRYYHARAWGWRGHHRW